MMARWLVLLRNQPIIKKYHTFCSFIILISIINIVICKQVMMADFEASKKIVSTVKE
jgi:hypothetical protein